MFWLSIRAWLTLLAVLAVLAGLSFVYATVKEWGRDEVRTEIQRKDQEAVDAAREARSPVRRCIDDGGLWSTATGVCRPRGVPGVQRANP